MFLNSFPSVETSDFLSFKFYFSFVKLSDFIYSFSVPEGGKITCVTNGLFSLSVSHKKQ